MAMWEQGSWLVTASHALSKPSSPSSATGGSGASPGTSTDWVATLLGPAVVAALITVIVGGLLQRYFTRQKDRDAALLDLRLKSLNEFYAPIRTLLGQNKVLHDSLRAEFAVTGEWHALDHLEEIKQNPSAKKLIEEVLLINKRIGEILEAKSGLDLGETEHASMWEVHRRMLAHAFADGAGDVKSELAYFPQAFEGEIVSMHKDLLAEVKSSVGIKK